MKDFIRDNIQFIFVLLLWLVAGWYGQLAGAVLIIPAFILLFRLNDRYQELFLGFLFILILSDSLEDKMAFAKSFKEVNIVMIALLLFSDLKKFQPFNHTYKYFIPFFLIAIVSLTQAGPNLQTGVLKTLSYILLYISVPNYVVRSFKDQGPLFLRNLIYFMLSIVIIGFLMKYINLEVAVSHGFRLRGIFGNPNGLGIFLILFFLIFTIINSYFPDLFSQTERWFIWIVVLYITYKTGSRTALLAIVMFLVFIKAYQISPFLGFIAFLTTLLGTEYVVSNLDSIIRGAGLDTVLRVDTLEKGSGRLIAWKFAWENIQFAFFLGKGFAYDEYLMRSNFDYLSRLGHEGGVHNTYLIIWLNTGLIGLLAFLRGFILLFLKAAKNCKLAIPAMFAIMFSVNFEPWLASSLNPFTILFLVMVTIMTDEVFQSAKEAQLEPEETLNSNENVEMA